MDDEQAIEWRESARFTLSALTEALKARLPDAVIEAYLFGSYARGDAHGDSDVDLMIVTETSQRWHQRALQYSTLLDDFEPLDLLVYTPEEWKRLNASRSDFWQQAAREWVRIR